MEKPVTLIVSEKPNTAKKIAEALADTNPIKKTYRKVSYYELTHNGNKVIVGCAVGHLFVLSEKDKKEWTYPVFNLEWIPNYMVSKSARFTKAYLDTLKKLASMADVYINGCDLDREGELIFKNILRFVFGKTNAKRMRYSTLTKEDLIYAYEHASPCIDQGLAEAGETRHILDFFWGVSTSRALILALKAAGGYKTLSTGRVQGPVLQILEKREEEIERFKSTPFWEIQLQGLIKNEKIIALHIKGKFWEKEHAINILKKCKGKPAIIDSVEKKIYKQHPPFPFDLTTLQREAYRNFGYSPKQTLDIAQSLYELGVISYPRTSSQKLPYKIGYRNILNALKKIKKYKIAELLLKKEKLKPNEGSHVDPAHPAIFPTYDTPDIKKLTAYQAKVYDLIVKRFLAVFGNSAVRETIKIILNVNNERFFADGVRTLEPNWMEFYNPYARFKEQLLPEVKKGDMVKIETLELLEKETQPPKRYTQSSILKEMTSKNLGTKGTRALILQTLYDRGYIKEKSIHVTPLGRTVVKTLEKYCPEIVSVDLTRKFENEIETIQEGKKKKDEVIRSAKEKLEKILLIFKQNEKRIGEELLKGVKEELKSETIIGKCKCGGDLKIIKSEKTGKQFVGCSGYKDGCRFSAPLPQKGKLTISSQQCTCGLNIISIKSFKKRSWKLCVKCGYLN
jgi:DNA topoisomerase-1